MIDWIFLLLIAGSAIFVIAGDLTARHGLNKKNKLIIAGAILLFLLDCLLFAFSLKRGQLAIAITLFYILNIIAIIPLGYFIFKEKLKKRQIVAIALVIVAIILMEI